MARRSRATCFGATESRHAPWRDSADFDSAHRETLVQFLTSLSSILCPGAPGVPADRRPRPTQPLATCGRRSTAASSPARGQRCRPPCSRPHPWPGDRPPAPCTRAPPADRPSGPCTARPLPLPLQSTSRHRPPPLPPLPGPFVSPDPDPPLVLSITEVSKRILVIPSQISSAHDCLYLLLARMLVVATMVKPYFSQFSISIFQCSFFPQ